MIHDNSAMDRPVGAPRHRRRSLWFAAIAGLVISAAAVVPPALRWARSETSVERSHLRLGTATRGDLVRDLSVEGRVVAAFHPTVFSPAPGTVSVLVSAGQVVERGDLLLRVASPELENRLRQERSNLLSTEADAERQQIVAKQARLANEQTVALLEVETQAAHRALARAERSRELGIVNDVDYEKAQDGVRVSELELEHARRAADYEVESLDFEVKDRRSRLERQRLVVAELERQVAELDVLSPVAGMVSRLHVEDREAVAASVPLATVVDLSAFDIEVEIAESAADEIVAGTDAVITTGGNDFRAVVKSVAPEVEGNRVKGVVAFTGPAPAGLRQNQRVRARVVLDTRTDVLKLPRGPFLEAGGGRWAYVVSDGVAVQRVIEVGAVSVTEVEVVAGLAEGEQVIVSDTSDFANARQVLLR